MSCASQVARPVWWAFAAMRCCCGGATLPSRVFLDLLVLQKTHERADGTTRRQCTALGLWGISALSLSHIAGEEQGDDYGAEESEKLDQQDGSGRHGIHPISSAGQKRFDDVLAMEDRCQTPLLFLGRCLIVEAEAIEATGLWAVDDAEMMIFQHLGDPEGGGVVGEGDHRDGLQLQFCARSRCSAVGAAVARQESTECRRLKADDDGRGRCRPADGARCRRVEERFGRGSNL
jgi:hypothetical protein